MTQRLPGVYQVYADMTIADALTRYEQRHDACPEVCAVNIGYRITDGEALALSQNDVQLVQLVCLHDVWLGPVRE